MTPNVVVADKADAPQAVEATVKSTEDKNVEVKKKAEQPNKEVVKPEKEEETTAEKSGSDKKSGSEVAYEKANTSKSPTGDTQDRSIKTTETDKSTEFKLTAVSYTHLTLPTTERV